MKELVSPQKRYDMELDTELVKDIIRFTLRNGYATFVNIEHFLERSGIQWRGTEKIYWERNETVVLWGGLSPRAAEIVRSVMRWEDFEVQKAPKSIYVIQGRVMQMPETSPLTLNNNIPSWCPAVVRIKRGVVLAATG